jgi:hypothetical protein
MQRRLISLFVIIASPLFASSKAYEAREVCQAIVKMMIGHLEASDQLIGRLVLTRKNSPFTDLQEMIAQNRLYETPQGLGKISTIAEAKGRFSELSDAVVEKLLAEVNDLEGYVFLIPDKTKVPYLKSEEPSSPFFSIDHQMQGFLGLPSHTLEQALEHELTHFKHWKELAEILKQEGLEPKEANLRAAIAMATPRGLISAESRAVASEFAWILKRGDLPVEIENVPTWRDIRKLFYRFTYPSRTALENIDFLEATLKCRAIGGCYVRGPVENPLPILAEPLLLELNLQKNEIMDFLIEYHNAQRSLVIGKFRALTRIAQSRGDLKQVRVFQEIIDRFEGPIQYNDFLSTNDEIGIGTPFHQELFDSRISRFYN